MDLGGKARDQAKRKKKDGDTKYEVTNGVSSRSVLLKMDLGGGARDQAKRIKKRWRYKLRSDQWR